MVFMDYKKIGKLLLAVTTAVTLAISSYNLGTVKGFQEAQNSIKAKNVTAILQSASDHLEYLKKHLATISKAEFMFVMGKIGARMADAEKIDKNNPNLVVVNARYRALVVAVPRQ